MVGAMEATREIAGASGAAAGTTTKTVQEDNFV